MTIFLPVSAITETLPLPLLLLTVQNEPTLTVKYHKIFITSILATVNTQEWTDINYDRVLIIFTLATDSKQSGPALTDISFSSPQTLPLTTHRFHLILEYKCKWLTVQWQKFHLIPEYKCKWLTVQRSRFHFIPEDKCKWLTVQFHLILSTSVSDSLSHCAVSPHPWVQV